MSSTIVTSHTANHGRLDEKVAIVTGSSSGLGRAIALAYLRAGARVLCADIRSTASPEIEREKTATTLELLQKEGGNERSSFIKTDVSIPADVEAAVKYATERFGRLDIMVNNAGFVPPPGLIHETEEDSFDKVMGVNARSVFLGSKYAIIQMLTQEPHSSGDRGWIINMASTAGLVGCPAQPSYCASKGAIIQLTKQVAIDYAQHKIHSNAICPGYIETSVLKRLWTYMGDQSEAAGAQHPLRRLGRVEDVVGPAIFLASADADWITGTVLTVDGGFTAQ